MYDPLVASMRTAASGLQTQAQRIKVVSENLANLDSTGKTPGSDPYRRKLVTFESAMDEVTGATTVTVDRVIHDPSGFHTEYRPGDPAADAKGYVKLPNVNMITEVTDMREANRSYEANLQIIKQAREMISMTIDLLKGA